MLRYCDAVYTLDVHFYTEGSFLNDAFPNWRAIGLLGSILAVHLKHIEKKFCFEPQLQLELLFSEAGSNLT